MHLIRQTYGIACAQTVFGGPTGVWLECQSCNVSMRCVGADLETDAVVADFYRSEGWTGEGDRMKKAKCPECNRV